MSFHKVNTPTDWDPDRNTGCSRRPEATFSHGAPRLALGHGLICPGFEPPVNGITQ